MTDPTWFKAPDVHLADEVPGLYAWYATLTFGAADWQTDLDADGMDLGMSAFGQLLNLQTSRLAPPNIRIGAVGHLWARWSGPLNEGGSSDIRRAIAQTHKVPSSGPEALRRVMQREDLRQATAEALASCAPHVAAPIYIGVAINLRDRLKTHLKSLRDAIDAMNNNGGQVPDDQRTTFGGRAAAAGFDEDALSVAVFPVAEAVNDLDDRRTVAEATEFLLNRWARPILGRR